MAGKTTQNGKIKLIQDIKNGTFAPLYIISGEEAYLKEYYLNQLKQKVVDETFQEFNLIEFEGKGLTPEQLTEAVDSYPAMAEKKLVVVTDFDLFKPSAAFSDMLDHMLDDLPDYLCLVFYFDTIDSKPDKRTKIYKKLEKSACFAEFTHLDEHELTAWIERRFQALDRSISPDVCAYMMFLCGNSMTNLLGEIEKAAAHATTGEIKKYNIDSVCSRVLEAVVFDLSDAITAGKFDRAVALVDDLIAQKNSEVMLFSVITRHIQRLYAAKLCEGARGGEKRLMELIGSKSPFYARQIQSSARKLPLSWLRNAASVCARTDTMLKGSVVDRQKQIELTLLELAAEFGANK